MIKHSQAGNRFTMRFMLISEMMSIAVFAIGLIGLAGWFFNISILKSFHPDFVSMKANTAASLVLTGAAMWLLQSKRVNSPKRLIAWLAIFIVTLIGLLTLCEYAFNLNLGIDQMLFKEAQGAIGTSYPGRQGPNTCFNFILIGISLMLLDAENKQGLRPAQFIILPEGLIALVAFIGYLYGIKEFYGFATATTMSLPTTIAFILIFFGILFSRIDTGITSIFTLDNAGGILARRFFFVVIAIPLVSEFLTELGKQANLYNSAYQPGFHVIIIIASLLFLVLLTANLLSRIDDERRRMEGQAQRHAAELAGANEQLRKSEEKYRTLVEDANSIIMRMDVEGKVAFFNDFAQKFFGYKEGEILGRSVLGTIVAPTDTSGHDLKAMIKDITLNPQRYKNNENENMCRDGRRVWIAWTNRAIPDDKGHVKEILCIGNDISKLKEAQEEILKSKEAAESSNKAKSSFLANMSHELRTPLNAIIGFSELMNDKGVGALNKKQEEYLGYVWESGKHLLSLINDILDLSKVEAGKMELELSEFDLKELLKKSLVFISEKAHKHRINLSTDIKEGIGIIRADERKIKQVVFNLLSNAVKFTPDAGNIGIDAEKTDKDKGEILVCVWDTGIGIDAKDSHKVFAEFEQIDSEYSRKYSGTGLGMSLSKKFIELHGGRMWFESQGKDKGARFYFTLPVRGG